MKMENNWISVKEKLPTEVGYYRAASYEDEGWHFNKTYFDGSKWFSEWFNLNGKRFEIDTPTHWMPLPK